MLNKLPLWVLPGNLLGRVSNQRNGQRWGDSEFEAVRWIPWEPDELKRFQVKGGRRRLRKCKSLKGRLQLCLPGCWRPHVNFGQESQRTPSRPGCLPYLSSTQCGTGKRSITSLNEVACLHIHFTDRNDG